LTRIRTLHTKEDVRPEQAGEIDAIVETLHRVTPPFDILLHSPGVAQKLMEAGAHIRLKSNLTPKERQLVIAALSREIDCNGEWVAHLNNAKNAGISDETMDLIKNRGDISKLPEDEREIVDYVQQLMGAHRIEQSSFDKLLAAHGERWLVEITATLGQYLYVGVVLNAFEVQPDVPQEQKLP
jgi:4-carboxymuconolactone decarboxylase